MTSLLHFYPYLDFPQKFTFPLTHYNYINIYSKFKRELDNKLELNPNDPKNNLILAKIFKAQGHFGKAANVLRRVLTQSPNNNEAKALLDSIKNYGS